MPPIIEDYEETRTVQLDPLAGVQCHRGGWETVGVTRARIQGTSRDGRAIVTDDLYPFLVQRRRMSRALPWRDAEMVMQACRPGATPLTSRMVVPAAPEAVEPGMWLAHFPEGPGSLDQTRPVPVKVKAPGANLAVGAVVHTEDGKVYPFEDLGVPVLFMPNPEPWVRG